MKRELYFRQSMLQMLTNMKGAPGQQKREGAMLLFLIEIKVPATEEFAHAFEK